VHERDKVRFAVAVLVLSEADVERLLPTADCIDVMGDVLADLARGRLHQPLRTIVQPPETESLVAVMPTYRFAPEPAYGLKVVCIFPNNPSRGLDTHQGAVELFDGETGQLRAVMNASAITAIRTAAVSAVATRALAREDARELAILGAGAQGRSHLDALAAVRPFERARVWSRTADHARALAADANAPFPVEVAASAAEAIRGADVVVTATASPTPVVERDWLTEGVHINAVGACLPTTRELDTATMADASLFVDRRESALNEAGDYVLAAEEGAIGPDHVRAELGEVLVGAVTGRTSASELTVFESLGLAVEDLAAAEFLYRRARESGAGATVEF
jgi:ornithine cyclodeaminase